MNIWERKQDIKYVPWQDTCLQGIFLLVLHFGCSIALSISDIIRIHSTHLNRKYGWASINEKIMQSKQKFRIEIALDLYQPMEFIF